MYPSWTMAGRRPLTPDEERRFLHVVRGLEPRDRLLATMQWQTGFRISETLSLTVGSVMRDGTILDVIGVAPRYLKGKRGTTRRVPLLPESRRALEAYLAHLGRSLIPTPDLPLFLSRKGSPDGTARPLCRESARRILMTVFEAAGISDDGRLGTHTLRKTWASNVYAAGDHDIMLLRAALGHKNVSTTQRYLEVDADAVLAAIRAVDFTRRPRHPEPAPSPFRTVLATRQPAAA